MRCALKNWKIFQMRLAKAICRDSNLAQRSFVENFIVILLASLFISVYLYFTYISMYVLYTLSILRLKF